MTGFASSLALFVALAATGGPPHRDLYVDAARGSDQGAGSAEAPFLTLARATRDLNPGDTLHIRGGVFHEPLNLARSGAPKSPIMVVGEGRPKIQASGDAISVTGSYIIVRGLDSQSTDWGNAILVGKHNHHVTIDNNILHDSGCSGAGAQYVDYITITHNTVFRNSERSPWQCSGISIYHPESFDHAPGVHNLIQSNLSYYNQNSVVDEHISHSGGHTTDGNGIIIDDGDHTQAETNVPPYDGLTLVIGNVVFNNGGRGIHVFHTANVVVANNVAYQDVKDPKLQGQASELSTGLSRRVTFLNNIAVARPDALPLMDGWDQAPTTWSHNVYRSAQAPRAMESPTRFDATNRPCDPKFVRPSLSPDGDFHLSANGQSCPGGVKFHLGADGAALLDPKGKAPIGLPDTAVPGAFKSKSPGH